MTARTVTSTPVQLAASGTVCVSGRIEAGSVLMPGYLPSSLSSRSAASSRTSLAQSGNSRRAFCAACSQRSYWSSDFGQRFSRFLLGDSVTTGICTPLGVTLQYDLKQFVRAVTNRLGHTGVIPRTAFRAGGHQKTDHRQWPDSNPFRIARPQSCWGFPFGEVADG